MSKWTLDQELAINKSGSNIIVSAGAGSGKTAVLTERVINKLINGEDINHLLILTFTNAAAAEMKDRIRKAIRDKKMYDQLDYIDSAYITTFDSYSQSIVKKYHYLLNISPLLNIVDDTIISIETNRIIDELFENSYGKEKFENLISSFCTKDDKKIKDVVISLSNRLDLKSDKEYYLNTYIDKYYSDSFINSVIDEYIKPVLEKKDEILSLFEDIKGYLDNKQFETLGEYLSNLIDATTYDEVINSFNDKSIRLTKLDDEAKIIYDDIKKVRDYITKKYKYSLEEIRINLLSTKGNVEEIIYLIQELDKQLTRFKLDNNCYTFNDIAKMAIRIVRDNEEVREEIKNYFNEIMLDEYQDTSDLQEEFISLISNNNVYMVGDIKQSIYRFRHANPDIFRNKYNDYSNNNGGFKIDLLKNFRSREEVLANINTIFDPIMDEKIGNADYMVSHRMVHGNEMYNLKAKTNYNMDILKYEIGDKYKDYNNAIVEAFIIANDIKEKVKSKYQVIDKDSKQLRDCNYGDFCIIMDRGGEFGTFSKILEYYEIPAIIWQDEKLNIEDDIAILKNIINLIIKVKENNIDSEFKCYFTSIARSYLFNYCDDKILDIFVNNSFKDDIIYSIVNDISVDIDNLTNNELLDIIIDRFDIYEKSILKGNIDACMVRYNIFNNLFSSLANLGYTPYDLPEYFKNSKDLDIKYSLNSKVPGNVNIMNIHKSKGLEFSICYFAGLSKEFNYQEINNSFLFDDKYGIIIPFYKDGIDNTILRSLFIQKFYEEDISEKIRLFYVALTRAKEKMIIVLPTFDNEEEVNIKVADEIRLKYRSLYDMLNSISTRLDSYSRNIDLDSLGITFDYNLGKKSLPKIFSNDKKIIVKEINMENCEISDSHFSKTTNILYTKEELSNMEYGTEMHYLLEITDFKNPKTDNKMVLDFINKLNLDGAKIYKEYEFIYEEDNERKHGIIDLMIEYNDHIDIIDYKLKNIIDSNYKNQVDGYKKYISNKTGKKVNTYLYSIINEEFNEIK